MGTNQKLQIVERYRASAIALSAYTIYKKSRDGTWSDSTVYPRFERTWPR